MEFDEWWKAQPAAGIYGDLSDRDDEASSVGRQVKHVSRQAWLKQAAEIARLNLFIASAVEARPNLVMLTKEQIRDLACDTLRDHGMHLVRELDKGEEWGGGNLVALMQIFAEHVAAAGPDNMAGVIDARMGDGWTRALATALKA